MYALSFNHTRLPHMLPNSNPSSRISIKTNPAPINNPLQIPWLNTYTHTHTYKTKKLRNRMTKARQKKHTVQCSMSPQKTIVDIICFFRLWLILKSPFPQETPDAFPWKALSGLGSWKSTPGCPTRMAGRFEGGHLFPIFSLAKMSYKLMVQKFVPF